MGLIQYYLEQFWLEVILRSRVMATTGTSALALSACGGGSGGFSTQVQGFPNTYVPPNSNFVAPLESDPNFEILKPTYIDPYWVASLEMDKWDVHIVPMLEDFERVIHYSFPVSAPEYDTFGLTGWKPASEEMKTATREILRKFEDILNITFSEASEPQATNVIAVSASSQAGTAGYSYFPNNFFEIGMDVYIANNFTTPRFLNEGITNYDYEVLVHEIGHALGLKHPFEANGANTASLNTYEDNTRNTAMSYNENSATFNGTLRPLDWMALTKFYGVKATFNASDDIYKFSNSGGTFILDGAGVDMISAEDTSQDVTVDLRPGAHSYLGTKSVYVTAANQLTISHGSDIENVVTGSGNDTIIGTGSNNVISTGIGSDIIYAGAGADTIYSGLGSDRIDLSELVQSRDTVTLGHTAINSGIDTIYGFLQGAFGDIFDVSEILSSSFELFPLVALGAAPIADFSGGILRIIGSDLSNSEGLTEAFQLGGGFETLSLGVGARSLIISANSQMTGEAQSVFSATGGEEEISVTQLAILQGNAVDIDLWDADNFSIIV